MFNLLRTQSYFIRAVVAMAFVVTTVAPAGVAYDVPEGFAHSEFLKQIRPELAHAYTQAKAAVAQSKEEREAIKKQKKEEAAQRKQSRQDEIAQRRRTDIMPRPIIARSMSSVRLSWVNDSGPR